MSSSYPEHDKLHAVKAESQALGEFLEWLQFKDGGNLILCDRGSDGELYMRAINVTGILANYFGVDIDKLEQEKLAMLEELREANSFNTPLQRAHQRGHRQEGTE